MGISKSKGFQEKYIYKIRTISGAYKGFMGQYFQNLQGFKGSMFQGDQRSKGFRVSRDIGFPLLTKAFNELASPKSKGFQGKYIYKI